MRQVELEERIVTLIASVLEMERSDIDSKFRGRLADLGCTSLQALQLNRILEEEFNCELNILDVVDAQGVEGICALVSRSISKKPRTHPEAV